MHQRAIVVLVCVALFMTTLDASIVNIGLPSIASAFGTPLSGTIEWVITGYLVVIAALLLTFGRLSDMVGRTPLWMAGLAIFTVGSVLCGAAPALGLLIAARVLQGVGAALILATSTAILTGAVPPAKRGRALGWSAVAIALGASAGPTLGGLLIERSSWRWIFYVNIPIGLGAIVATRHLLPREIGRGRGRFDPLGALLLAAGIAALNLGLSLGQSWGWTSARLLTTLTIGVGALVAAIMAERRAPDPIIDLNLFRDRVFVSALVSLIFSMLALFAVGFLLPFYFEELRGFSTAHSGLLLTPYSLAMVVVSPIAGALADRFGSRWLAPLGLAMVASALLLLAGLSTTSTTWDIAWRLTLAGVGQGIFLSPNMRALMGAVPARLEGEASGLLATARIAGQSLSVTVAGAVFAGLGGAAAGSALIAQRTNAPLLAAESAVQARFIGAFQAAFIVCAAFAAVGVLAALVRGHERPATLEQAGNSTALAA